MRSQTVGVAVCHLPREFDESHGIERRAARRNVKKARRLGYEFRKIEYNDYLSDVREIRCSANERQGALPEEFVNGDVRPSNNPPSRDEAHDYPFFGVLKNESLFSPMAVALCADEFCMLEHVYGHAERQPDGVVPMLIVGIAEHLIRYRPLVKYFCYGTYFGASRRCGASKRKFLFEPHHVCWKLG